MVIRSPWILAASLLVLSSCAQPSPKNITVYAIFEMHHEILRRLPDDVECILIGFPSQEQRRGLEVAYTLDHARTWVIVPSSARTGPIFFRLRAHPRGTLPSDKCLFCWKELEVEVLWEGNQEGTKALLEMLRHGRAQPE
jgi:hypothetical protein